ncbi:MAG: hypothetical protein IBX70_13710 [Clostridia bacterium]|nr:hypothetical protein [Clostridia bacterium]
MKKWILGLILLIGLMSLVGCGSESAAATTEDEKVTPERKAEVTGVVKSIVGNEVTVSLVLKGSANQGESGEGITEGDSTELTEEEKAAKQAERRAANQGKTAAGQAGTGAASGELELSGETIDIVIPVGTKILQSTGTGSFFELDIADVKRGMSVKIWLLEGGEGDTNLAEFIQVLTR